MFTRIYTFLLHMSYLCVGKMIQSREKESTLSLSSIPQSFPNVLRQYSASLKKIIIIIIILLYKVKLATSMV